MADVLRRTASALGQTLVTLGLVVLLFVVYELWFTGVHTSRQQDALAAELAQTWDDPRAGAAVLPGETPAPSAPPAAAPATVPLGRGWAVLRVPRLGQDWARVVVQGVGVEDLKKGPGHWPDSAEAGEVGNVVLSGHRTTYGAPFNELDALQPGDALVVETRDAWHTYRMTEQRIVAPTAVEVALPVPGEPGAVPSRRLLTLTTCHPEFSARQRLVLHAELEESLPKAAGRAPAALVA